MFAWPAIGTLDPLRAWAERAVTLPLAIAPFVVARSHPRPAAGQAPRPVIAPTVTHTRSGTLMSLGQYAKPAWALPMKWEANADSGKCVNASVSAAVDLSAGYAQSERRREPGPALTLRQGLRAPSRSSSALSQRTRLRCVGRDQADACLRGTTRKCRCRCASVLRLV